MSLFGTVDATQISQSNQNISLTVEVKTDNPANILRISRSEMPLVKEYFAYQVLAALGMNVPNIKIVKRKLENLFTGKMEDVIYTDAVLVKQLDNADVEDFRDAKYYGGKFRLDASHWVGDLADLIVNDQDGSQHLYTKVGNRFYRLSYDREKASPQALTEQEIKECEHRLSSTSFEQKLAFQKKLAQVLERKTLDTIFDNSRVKNTPELERFRNQFEDLKAAWHKNIILMNEYLKSEFAAQLKGYDEREQIRREIAETVAQELGIVLPNYAKAFIDNLVEDLRGLTYLSEPHKLTRAALKDKAFIKKITEAEDKRYAGIEPSKENIKHPLIRFSAKSVIQKDDNKAVQTRLPKAKTAKFMP